MSAKSLYRKLLKAQRFTFNGDQFQIINAKNFTRQQFDKNSKESDQEKIKDLLKVADQAAIIIERNLVQGIKNKDSVFSLQLNAAKEMNDNSSIKSAKKQPAQKI